jgi:diguanylate cyclase (GGDEF)-like protein/PAS domain S-box-containing protein
VLEDAHSPQSKMAGPSEFNILQALRVSELRYRRLFESARDGILLVNSQSGQIEDVNPYLVELLGYTHAEFLGKKLWDAGMFSDQDQCKSMFHMLQTTGYSRYEDLPLRTKNGTQIDVEIVSNAYDCGGTLVIQCNIRNIAGRRQERDKLRMAAVSFESQQGTLITDKMGVVLRVNSAFRAMTGFSEHELIGHRSHMLRSGRQDAAFYHHMWDTLNRTGGWQGEIWDRHKDGTEHLTWLAISAVHSADGSVSHYVGTYYDMTERKEADSRISALAFFDPLTGLPNRTLLADRLQQATTACVRNSTFGALLFVDLDHFKNINDTLGHDAGDQLLKQIANHLRISVRQGDTVARIGGDEFIVLLPNLSKTAHDAALETQAIATKMLLAMDQDFPYDHHTQHCSASIGATLFRDASIPMEGLIKEADQAMYEAKHAGRNAYRLFKGFSRD